MKTTKRSLRLCCYGQHDEGDPESTILLGMLLESVSWPLIYFFQASKLLNSRVGWPNGKALLSG